jgi:hypothetical protein
MEVWSFRQANGHECKATHSLAHSQAKTVASAGPGTAASLSPQRRCLVQSDERCRPWSSLPLVGFPVRRLSCGILRGIGSWDLILCVRPPSSVDEVVELEYCKHEVCSKHCGRSSRSVRELHVPTSKWAWFSRLLQNAGPLSQQPWQNADVTSWRRVPEAIQAVAQQATACCASHPLFTRMCACTAHMYLGTVLARRGSTTQFQDPPLSTLFNIAATLCILCQVGTQSSLVK